MQAKATLRTAEDTRLSAKTREVRAAYVEREARKLTGHRPGMTLDEARSAVEKRIGGVLLPDFILPWDDEDLTAKVGDVLDNPSRFEGQTLADPIDGDERCKAKVMLGGDGLPFIHSFAHGGGVYRLRYDARAIHERVDAATDKPGTLAGLMLAADLDAVEEELLITEVARAAGVGVRAIRSKINEAKTERDSRGRDDASATVEQLNQTYALVIVGNKTAVMKFEGKTFQLLQVASFKQWFANRFIRSGGRLVQLGDYWLSHPNRRQYKGIEFAPTRGREGYYNLWRGFAVEPRPGDCSNFLAHMRNNVCQKNEFIYKWVIGWFAHIAQRPGVRIGTSLALIGRMGVGKTKVGEVMGSLFGEHYALVADPRYVTGQFNAHMMSLLLLQADEAFWAGDKRSEGKLRDLITGKDHFIEFKGHDPIRFANYIYLLVTGAEDWVVPAGFDERRFATLEVGDDHIQDIEYFAAIDEEMNSGGREALLHHLLNFDLSQVNLRVVPRTAALFEQQIYSANPQQQWWYDTLQSGHLPWSNISMAKNECPRTLLFDRYIRHANATGVRRRSIETMLGKFLSRYVGPELTTTRREFTVEIGTGIQRTQNTESERFYVFPPLKVCRERFAAKMRQEITWEEPDAEWQWQKQGESPF